MIVSESIVILFNGGEKTKATPQECDNVRPYFLQANKLSKAIYTAIIDKDIEIDEENGRLIFEDTFELEI